MIEIVVPIDNWKSPRQAACTWLGISGSVRDAA
jgi:hypothetical protein